MTLYTLKPRFQALLRPLVGLLYRAGVTANQVTLTACAGSLALGIFLLAQDAEPQWFLLVPLWLLVRMALNAIDGMLAREFRQASALGAYLNELGDVLSDAALYAPFAFLPGSNALLVAAVIVLSVVSEMAGVLGADRRYDGPMGKSDRAFAFGAIALLAGLDVPLASALDWIWAALAVLLLFTIVNRVRKGL